VTLRAPFPAFGSKRHAAHLIWQALGDVGSYCEPFCFSAATLLMRPGGAGRIETINDISGHVANFWRSVREKPEEVAHHLDYPVIETDLHARHRWLVARHDDLRAGLDADPDWCDPKAAGWWAWGASAWIGSGWCDNDGKRLSIKLPSIAHTGCSVHAVPPTQLPHMSGRTAYLHQWVTDLSVRLRRVRVACGDFRRVLTPSALCDSIAPQTGILLDPPYAVGSHLYGSEGHASVAAEAAAWAAQAAAEHPAWRIVFCGHEGEHDAALVGWRVVAWDPSKAGFSSGGYGRKNGNPQRERLWLSPACRPVEGEAGRQASLFGGA
jgi:DNA adenine methylase